MQIALDTSVNTSKNGNGSPWGRGFAVGLAVALVVTLPLFFLSSLLGPRITKQASSPTRDFSASQDSNVRTYLSTDEVGM